MSVKRLVLERYGIYFLTITCSHWLHLFELADSYQVVYKWFDHLKSKGHFINAFVIMPNHFHALISFRKTERQSINSTVGNGKRFMAYEIVHRLKMNNLDLVLRQLEGYVNESDRRKKKLHDVFEPSFDWKECCSDKFIEQKLTYIHENPCRGKWKLVESCVDYMHSSADYYATGQVGTYPVTNVEAMKDVDLTISLE